MGEFKVELKNWALDLILETVIFVIRKRVDKIRRRQKKTQLDTMLSA